jgi:hypothetical protein
MGRTSNYALRLLASVKAEAEKVAAAEGTTLNQFINVAVAEKLAALRTVQFFQERSARADFTAFDRLLTRAGGEPPRPGDEIDDGTRRTLRTRKPQSRTHGQSGQQRAKKTVWGKGTIVGR